MGLVTPILPGILVGTSLPRAATFSDSRAPSTQSETTMPSVDGVIMTPGPELKLQMQT